jgi:hypothetical protein
MVIAMASSDHQWRALMGMKQGINMPSMQHLYDKQGT